MAENMTNAPVASTIVFIHQISDQPNLSKVRFLGCVIDYDERNGTILVEHKPCTITQHLDIQALVDVKLIIESTKPSCLTRGTWVNVIGYVQEQPRPSRAQAKISRGNLVVEPPRVQAVLMWSAGAVRLDKYEQTVTEHLAQRADEEHTPDCWGDVFRGMRADTMKSLDFCEPFILLMVDCGRNGIPVT